jgi:shikimate dehydrogenase
MPRLGVIGWPVDHSRSPAMHNAAFAALGMSDWRYQHLPVAPALFRETTLALGRAGFLGANVTIPHKEAALALVDQASEAARSIGAANTLTFLPDGSAAAENTDAPGLISTVPCPTKGLSAMVLGAGGSARATVWALLDAGAREVSIWNRNPARAEALASELGAGAVARAVDADLLVNCTPVGLAAGFGSAPLQRSASELTTLNQLALTLDQVGKYPYVIDLAYRDGPTPLLYLARRHGAKTVDGLQVLVAQGALSFQLWTGRPPPLEVMRRAAEAPIAAKQQ